MFAWLHRKQDVLVAEMLGATLQAYRTIFAQFGQDILLKAIKQYEGLSVVPDTLSSKNFCYRYPNELRDFVFTAVLKLDPYVFQVQAEDTYFPLVLTMSLAKDGILVTDPAELRGGAKALAQWWVDQGAIKSIRM